MDSETRRRLIEEHLEAIRRLESPPAPEDHAAWPPRGYYLLWHVVIGMTLGGIGALAPKCARCGVTIIGHGVQAYGAIYCCAHCARGEGVDRVRDRVS